MYLQVERKRGTGEQGKRVEEKERGGGF